MLYGTFVLGYDGDNPDTFQKTLDYAMEEKMLLANFNPLTPMPGTKLYNRLQEEGKLLHKAWWLAEDFRYGDAAFTPAGISSTQLQEGCLMARKSFYSLPSILIRSLEFKANAKNWMHLKTFFLGNLISRWEIRSKQGKSLGNPKGES